jgi:hypothetical protein
MSTTISKASGDDISPELKVLLVEYQSAVQLYNTVLNVGYQRMLALFALHGGLLAAVFSVGAYTAKIVLAVTGFLFSLLTVATIEHFIQIYLLRLFQAREVEIRINTSAGAVLSTFERIHALLVGRPGPRSISFDHLSAAHSLPQGWLGTFILRQKVFVIERALGLFVVLLWLIIATTEAVTPGAAHDRGSRLSAREHAGAAGFAAAAIGRAVRPDEFPS